MIFYRNAPPEERPKLEAIWREAGLGDLPKVEQSPDEEDEESGPL
jgi:hypothetical protein